MEEKMISVPLDDYTDMAIMHGRVKALEAFVNSEKYSISKENIACILGFELKKGEGDEQL